MDDLAALAARAARAAGALLLERFAGPRVGLDTKSSATDMVSDADRASESLIVETILAARADDAILGEEGGARAGGSGYRWVIDPLDGTTNFLYGIPQWAVSIACEDGEGVVAGVVYDPARDECFSAVRGGGAALNGAPIAVTSQADLADALIATGFPYRPGDREAAALLLPHVLPRVRDIRRAGAAALDLAWVAAGRVDGYYESPTEWWDVAAGRLLVTEAGGVVVDLPPFGDGDVPGTLAAGPGIAGGLRALVHDALTGATGGSPAGDAK